MGQKYIFKINMLFLKTQSLFQLVKNFISKYLLEMQIFLVQYFKSLSTEIIDGFLRSYMRLTLSLKKIHVTILY